MEGFYFTTPLARSSYALVLGWFPYDRQYRYDRYKKKVERSFIYLFIYLFQQYLDRGAQFSEAGLNGALRL